MTKVDFYHLCEKNQAQIIPFAARLSDKISRMNHKIYLHALNQDMCHVISHALWATIPESFLAHDHYPEQENENPSLSSLIEIGFGQEPGEISDVLINLNDKIPSFFSRFNRVLEILPDEEPWKQNARERYRFYKDRGYLVNYHEISL